METTLPRSAKTSDTFSKSLKGLSSYLVIEACNGSQRKPKTAKLETKPFPKKHDDRVGMMFRSPNARSIHIGETQLRVGRFTERLVGVVAPGRSCSGQHCAAIACRMPGN